MDANYLWKLERLFGQANQGNLPPSSPHKTTILEEFTGLRFIFITLIFLVIRQELKSEDRFTL